MRSKPLILLTVALGCGMVAAVGVSQALLKPAGDGTEPMVEILVATKDLSQADRITAETVKLEKWPKRRVPEGAISKLEKVDGKFTRQMIFSGEPILERKITDSRASFSVNLPPGFRIFDIPGEAGYIKPGDHVDIVGLFRPRGRGGVPETRTVLRNVKVHGINGNTSRDADETETGNRNSRGTTFQLLVRENQLEALALAKGMGELQLHLRPLEEKDDDTTDTGEEFLSWVRDFEAQSQPATEDPKADPILPGILTQLTASLPRQQAEQEKPHRMVILTPDGMTEYQWTDSDRIPRPVSPASTPSMEGADGESRNVSSGYGGYTPTYPKDADLETGPDEDGGTEDNASVSETD
ncbi:MAG: Flp pilus assembly protein CpaB [Pirellulaceae bacterium]|nr:MAG: Flp pilus assembly protein CpaB [Pirellulaceae bacterium]